MDVDRFDRLTRSLAIAGPRRGVLSGLLVGAVSLLGWSKAQDAVAKDCKKIKDKKKRKACQKKAQGTTAQPPASDPPPPLACGAGGPCRVFLSSTLHAGNLGGLSGADAICQGLAKEANLPGTYRAWLSDSTSSPDSRFVPSSGPYQLVTGTTIAANFTDLTDGSLAARIDVTETGGGVGGESGTWTHTKIDGAPGGFGNVNCGNWTLNAATGGAGNIGFATSNDSAWTAAGSSFCNVPSHLYCFQQS